MKRFMDIYSTILSVVKRVSTRLWDTVEGEEKIIMAKATKKLYYDVR